MPRFLSFMPVIALLALSAPVMAQETADGDVPYDLIQDFTVRFWLKYTSKMARLCLSRLVLEMSSIQF